jgi:exonuclease III
MGLRSSGALSGLWAIEDEAGKIVGYSDPFTIELSPAASSPVKFIADLPTCPRGAIRVMSLNVENTSTVKSPVIFGRLFQAVNPDVVLIQEWNEGDADQVQSWFTALVPHTGNWFVHKPRSDTQNGGGVAVVSRFPLEPLPDDITCTFTNDKGEATERPVRFAAARLDTPIGNLVAGSIHLKCCGSKDTREDRQRMGEARAISTVLQRWSKEGSGQAGIVVGGDMNLVGSRPPLDILRAQSDSDGSDLSVAEAFVLGDRSMYTWVGDGGSFAPGRLDYMVFSDARYRAVNTFILDTTRLGEESLARLGLDATDSAATDHRPVIVDLAPR